MKVYMGEYYNLGHLGLVRTIGKARNCETRKTMIMFATVKDGGIVGDTLLINEEDFLERINK